MQYPDIYYTHDYVRLFEAMDHGTSIGYHFASDLGEVFFSFILRPVEINNQPTGFFDIISPYGYGGPAILRVLPNRDDELIRAFDRDFSAYCRKNKIVSEFVRFHPLLRNVEYCKNIYQSTWNRHTAVVDLSVGDLMTDSFSSKCRNMIRKAVKNGVTIQFDFDGTTVDDFHRLYTLTMQKNMAQDYYYFTKEYFDETIQTLKGSIFILNALYEGRIVSAAMFMHHQQFMHYHFSATHPEYYKLACNNLILSEASHWGKSQGKQILHLGGGFTTAEDDPLFVFKKSFVKNELNDFWIGQRIHNHNIYQQLVELAQKNKAEPLKTDFFPLYRL